MSVSKIQRAWDKAWEWADIKFSKKILISHFAEGGTLTQWKAEKLQKKVKEMWQEQQKAQFLLKKTNVPVLPVPALKSRCVDACLEEILQSGRYQFPDLFMMVNPYGEAPLTALLLFETKKACRVRVTVIGKSACTDFSYELPEQKKHRVPVLGLYPKRKNPVRIELLDEGGQMTKSRIVEIRTRALPRDLRGVVEVKKMDKNPGFKNILITGGVNLKSMVFDRQGEIRYYLRRQVKGYGIFPTEKGHFIYMEKAMCNTTWTNPQCAVYEDMDYLGRIHKTFLTDNGLHHTVEAKQGGNLLVGTNTVGTQYCEDAMEEVDCNTGEVVWQLHFEDLFGGAHQDITDWAHINSAQYDPATHSMLCSLRNVHGVVCVDYDTKELKWILSDPAFWQGTPVEDKLLKPEGDIPWFYQQHSAFWMEEDLDGNPDTRQMILFDNHWEKRRHAPSFDGDMKHSYISIYSINEKERTVSLWKRFPCRKSKIRGNGIYVADRHRLYSMEGAFAKEYEDAVGGVYEYDYDTGKKVSEILIKPGFFRAYEFKPEMEDLCQPQKQETEYLLGQLKRPHVLTEEEKEKVSFNGCGRVMKSILKYQMRESCFFVRELDHELKDVYFHGKKQDYGINFEDTEQVYGAYFGGSQHYLCIQLDQLPKDRYEIYVRYKDEFGKTGKYISL